MKVLSKQQLTAVSGGVVFGPGWINGQSSYIVMLKPDEEYYYYNFNYQNGIFFKQDGQAIGPDGPVDPDSYRTFINQSGYRCYFVPDTFFDAL